MSDIYEHELLRAIQAAHDAYSAIPQESIDPDTITTGEFAYHNGWSDNKAREALKQLAQRGVIVPEWVNRLDAWGVRQRRKGYRLVKTS